jgi:hypothetical protein
VKSQPASYRAAERSQTIKRTHLYRFNYEGTNYYFAGYDQDVTVTGGPGAKMADPQVFAAAQIAHSNMEESMDSVPSAVAVNLAAIDTELRKYLLSVSPKSVDVEIWRVNSASLPGSLAYGSDLKMIFKGVLDSISFDDLIVSANCVTLLAQEDRPVPRFNYQKQCNHSLYGAQCGVNKALYSASVTITGINKQSQYIDLAMTTINVGSPARSVTVTAETFAGGFVEDSESPVNKMGIIACDLPGGGVTRLWLNWMPRTMAAGQSATIYCGCLKIKRVCDALFFNLPNFGGQPYIPILNPAVDGVSS